MKFGNTLSVRAENIGSAFIGIAISAAMLGISAFPLLFRSPETAPARLEPVQPMKHSEFAKADLTPEAKAAILPSIKLAACTFSQKAVRHFASPAPTGFAPCGLNGPQVTVSEDLIDITVSGIATVEKTDRPFTVTLQHNPRATTEDGLIVTGIRIIAPGAPE